MSAAASLEGGLELTRTLEALGVTHAFGLPGTQTVPLFEALRRSRLRTVVPSSELAAAFMAGAWFRVAGRPAVLVTIPGPGFAYALAGLAEARLDSAALIHVTIAAAEGPDARFRLQAIPQRPIGVQLAKAVLRAAQLEDVAPVLRRAHALAIGGEPGPVIVELGGEAVADAMDEDAFASAVPDDPAPAWQRFAAARRPLVYAGQGALASATALWQLVEHTGTPVMTTPSARGLLPEDHPLALPFDPCRGGLDEANALLAEADLVLVLGAKLGHNGTAGRALRLDAARTVQVDADRSIAGASLPVSLALTMPVERLMAAAPAGAGPGTAWEAQRLQAARQRLRRHGAGRVEPRVAGGTAEAFFAALRAALAREAILVTDTGLHQVMARRHFEVLAPGGLLCPSDFQSMGFGLPAAIAAKLAAPERPVVALVGDGSMAINGLELATAAALGLSLPVLVFVDGQLNQIRLQQQADYGHDSGVALAPLDFAALADAAGAQFKVVGEDLAGDLAWAASQAGPSLLAVPVGDSAAMLHTRLARRSRDAVAGLMGPGLTARLKRLLRRR